MSLTDDWKAGELPDGDYYIETDVGVKTAMLSTIYPTQKIKLVKGFIPKGRVKQILAPVPTYQEYLESESHCAVYSDRNKWLKEENAKLRELLKECLIYIPYSYPQFQTEKRIDLDSAKLNLITRINAAIGESEK